MIAQNKYALRGGLLIAEKPIAAIAANNASSKKFSNIESNSLKHT